MGGSLEKQETEGRSSVLATSTWQVCPTAVVPDDHEQGGVLSVGRGSLSTSRNPLYPWVLTDRVFCLFVGRFVCLFLWVFLVHTLILLLFFCFVFLVLDAGLFKVPLQPSWAVPYRRCWHTTPLSSPHVGSCHIGLCHFMGMTSWLRDWLSGNLLNNTILPINPLNSQECGN